MKANELRIGNWVEVKTLKSWIQEQVSCGKYLDVMNNEPNCDARPIPLDETWLERFGFEKDKKFDAWRFNGYEVAFWSSGAVSLESKDMPDYEIVSNLKYVHSLQNLYHALTGEELEIKETAQTTQPYVKTKK